MCCGLCIYSVDIASNFKVIFPWNMILVLREKLGQDLVLERCTDFIYRIVAQKSHNFVFLTPKFFFVYL